MADRTGNVLLDGAGAIPIVKSMYSWRRSNLELVISRLLPVRAKKSLIFWFVAAILNSVQTEVDISGRGIAPESSNRTFPPLLAITVPSFQSHAKPEFRQSHSTAKLWCHQRREQNRQTRQEEL